MKVREDTGLVFTGETLDVKSRGAMRRHLDKKIKDDWGNCWTSGLNKFNRDWMVTACLREIRKYWSAHEGEEELAVYSEEAIREEIDFFLPKSFWRWRVVAKWKGKHRGSGLTAIDPDWPTFEDWLVDYPETIDRLYADFDSSQDRKAYWKRKKEREKNLFHPTDRPKTAEANDNQEETVDSGDEGEGEQE